MPLMPGHTHALYRSAWTCAEYSILISDPLHCMLLYHPGWRGGLLECEDHRAASEKTGHRSEATTTQLMSGQSPGTGAAYPG